MKIMDNNKKSYYNDFVFSDDFEIISELPENQYIIKAKYNRYYGHSYYGITGSISFSSDSPRQYQDSGCTQITEFTTQAGEICLLKYREDCIPYNTITYFPYVIFNSTQKANFKPRGYDLSFVPTTRKRICSGISGSLLSDTTLIPALTYHHTCKEFLRF
jgi:hypothetical protein